jgi:hypothetical protein
MRVLLRALSLAAALVSADATFACPSDVGPHQLSGPEITAPLTDMVLLNHEDDHAAALQSMAEAWSASPDWDRIEFLPSPTEQAGFGLGITIVVDTEGEPLMDVAHTGSTEPAEAPVAASIALDGFEDR